MPDTLKTPERSVDPLASSTSTDATELVRANSVDETVSSNNGDSFMTTNFDFASLQTAETEQNAADFSEYQNMLREIAAGKCKRSKQKIVAVLKNVDRDVRLLEDDVRKRTERDQMIAEAKRAKEYEAQRQKLRKQLDALDADFKKAEDAYEEKRWPIAGQCDGFAKKLRDIDGIRRKLVAECDDAALLLERERLQHQLNDPAEDNLYSRQLELSREIGNIDRLLTNFPISLNRQQEKQELKARLTELNARYKIGEKQKLEFEARKEKVKQSILEIEERMMFV